MVKRNLINGKTVHFALSDRQRGNALFLILIAVALFAALSYAVTQSGRGGGNTNAEKARLDAGQILQTVGRMQTALTRLQVTNACTETMISFETATSTNYANSNAPTDKSCNFFDANGGGLSGISVPSSATTTGSSRSFGYSASYRIVGVGTNNSDLIMGVSDLTPDVCAQLNSLLGIATIGNRTGNPSPGRFVGGYDDSGTAVSFDTTASGRMAACIKVSQMGGQAFSSSDVTNPSYTFYSVLIAR